MKINQVVSCDECLGVWARTHWASYFCNFTSDLLSPPAAHVDRGVAKPKNFSWCLGFCVFATYQPKCAGWFLPKRSICLACPPRKGQKSMFWFLGYIFKQPSRWRHFCLLAAACWSHPAPRLWCWGRKRSQSRVPRAGCAPLLYWYPGIRCIVLVRNLAAAM